MSRWCPVRAALPLLCVLLVCACSSSRAGGARSTSDPRVRSFAGQVPPAYWRGGAWIKAPLRHTTGRFDPPLRVQYVQFAFPS